MKSKKIPIEEKDDLKSFSVELGKSGKELEEGELTVDVFQTADEIVMISPVAGVKKRDLTVSITHEGRDYILTIKGERRFEFKTEKEDYFCKECFWGNFSRAIILPESVDVSKATSTFKDGILVVRIPKVEKIKTRIIEIQ